MAVMTHQQPHQAAASKENLVPFLQTASDVLHSDAPNEKAHAKAISDEIDSQIAADKSRRKARRETGDIALLLLGQSESGKSTLLKQFMLMHSVEVFDEERSGWRPVILLNILNTVRNVMKIVRDFQSGVFKFAGGPGIGTESLQNVGFIQRLEHRSVELMKCEENVVNMLVHSGHIQTNSTTAAEAKKELYMRRRNYDRDPESRKARGSFDSPTRKSFSDDNIRAMDDISAKLRDCQEDLNTLWMHPVVKLLVKERLQEEWRNYFMTNIPRIAVPSYNPTNADILHVRIMTMGVVEHTFRLNLPASRLQLRKDKEDEKAYINMQIYDVGGARGQRHTWASFFEEANAIIFLAPISAFDQFLAEDTDVNRIRDSMEVFSKICDNPLLGSVQLVLFLNKIDILENKLRSGIRVKDFITSYGDQPNDEKTVKKYFASHFNQVFMRSKVNTNGTKRNLYMHFTSVVDTKATKVVLGNVQDSLLRQQMKDARLL